MEKKEDIIGQLFRTTFEEHTVPLENGEWEGLNTQLVKRNFFHFNAFQFNIYYASMIIFCFLTCLFVGTHYTYTNFLQEEDVLSSEGKVNRNEEKGGIANEPLQVKTTNEIPIDGSPRNRSYMAKSEQADLGIGKSKKSTERVDLPYIEKSTLTALDTTTIGAPTPIVEPVVSKPDSVKPKPKKIVYITKQDTIIQFDTVQAPKKKKKWFK